MLGCRCFKNVRKLDRLIRKSIGSMSQFLLGECQDLEQFYSNEGELQNYLQKKLKKIRNAGKFLSQFAKRRVKELLNENAEIIKKLEKFSIKDKCFSELHSDIRKRGPTSTDFKSESGLNMLLKKCLELNFMKIQSNISSLEHSYSELIACFVLYPKIVKNLVGLYQDKQEKQSRFDIPRKQARKSKINSFLKNGLNDKSSLSYIENIYQKLISNISSSIMLTDKVAFSFETNKENVESESMNKLFDTK